MSEEGSGLTVSKNPVPPNDAHTLDEQRRQEQRGGDVDIHAREQRVRWQMTPGRVSGKDGQRLVCSWEDFVGGSAKERVREQHE